jgi:hypothetical protein
VGPMTATMNAWRETDSQAAITGGRKGLLSAGECRRVAAELSGLR